MGLHFHKTGYIKRFFDQQLPAMIEAVNRLADVYESKQNSAEQTVFVCYRLNFSPLNKKHGTLSNMTVRLCGSSDAVEWVKEIVAKYTDDGYKPLSDERLEEFYDELPYVRYCGLQMKHDSGEEGDEFALIVEKFIVKTEI